MGPPHIRGLRWLPSRIDNAIECAFAADADADTVVALLQTIPRRGGLRFFDYLYHGEPPPQVAVDPGAIFCVYRRLRGALFATCGNHGWSSPWTPVSHQRLGAFVLDCIDSNRGDGARTGVGDRRRTGVGNQRQRAAFAQQAQQALRRRRLVVLVQGEGLGANAVVVEQATRVPRVLAGDGVDAAQHLQRARADVAQVSQRRGDHI